MIRNWRSNTTKFSKSFNDCLSPLYLLKAFPVYVPALVPHDSMTNVHWPCQVATVILGFNKIKYIYINMIININ